MRQQQLPQQHAMSTLVISTSTSTPTLGLSPSASQESSSTNGLSAPQTPTGGAHNGALLGSGGSAETVHLPTHEVATLFRGASLAVKFLSEYGAWLAQTHIRAVLHDAVRDVLAGTGSYEINPAKVATLRNARSDAQRFTQLTEADDRDANLRRITDTCQAVLERIVAECDAAPAEFRALLKTFATEIAYCFGDAVGFSTALGALFLRFYCPALVKPVEYGIVARDSCPPGRITALIYCAKVLQSLANNQPFGAKEDYMVDLNPFIAENSQRTRDFFARFISSPAADVVLPPAEAADAAADLRAAIVTATVQGGGVLTLPPATEPYDVAALTASKGATPEVLRAASELRQRVGTAFPRMYAYSRTRKPDVTVGPDGATSENEIRATELLMMHESLLDDIAATLDEAVVDEKASVRQRRRKDSLQQRDGAFLRLLLAPDMLVMASLCEMIKYSEATPVVSALARICTHFGVFPRLILHTMRRELMLTYRKWQVPDDILGGNAGAEAMSARQRFESTVSIKVSRAFFRRWRARFVIFADNELRVYASKSAFIADAAPLNVQPLADMVSIRPAVIGDARCCDFRVEMKNNMYMVRCDSHLTMRRLVDVLNTALAELVVPEVRAQRGGNLKRRLSARLSMVFTPSLLQPIPVV